MIYVNGDSFSFVSDGKTFCDFLGDLLDTPSQNASFPGSCNSRIIRTTLRDLLRISEPDMYVVINLSFILRTEIWDSDIAGNNRFVNDGEFVSIQPANGPNWFFEKAMFPRNKYSEYSRAWLQYYNPEAEMTNLLKELVLLTSWLKNRNIKYVVVSSALQETVDLNSEFIRDFWAVVRDDPNIINFFEMSFTEWCLQRGHVPITKHQQEIRGRVYNIGHHGESAHRDFANFLFENYFKNYKYE